MLGFNGGLMGVRRTPTTGTATGLWFQNEQSVAKRAGIWPLTDGDPYWANVSLLLRCDGTNGSTTFTDLSANAHAITATGTAQVATAEKQFGTGSLSVGFSGTGYIDTPASSTFSFPGDFTIECWAKFDATQPGGTSALLELNDYNNGILIRSDSTYVNGTSIGWTGLVNTSWRHLAITRSGSTVRWFRDGTVDSFAATISGTINSSNGKLRFGADIHTGGGSPMKGYIDEIRVTKGVARYTANFTAPTAAFPSG
jgi:hypothetical protein